MQYLIRVYTVCSKDKNFYKTEKKRNKTKLNPHPVSWKWTWANDRPRIFLYLILYVILSLGLAYKNDSYKILGQDKIFFFRISPAIIVPYNLIAMKYRDSKKSSLTWI